MDKALWLAAVKGIWAEVLFTAAISTPQKSPLNNCLLSSYCRSSFEFMCSRLSYHKMEEAKIVKQSPPNPHHHVIRLWHMQLISFY